MKKVERVSNRFWQVYITLAPVEGEKNYQRKRSLGVGAPTIHQAINLVLKEYPGATIWTIQHRGEINHDMAEYRLGEFHNEDNPTRR